MEKLYSLILKAKHKNNEAIMNIVQKFTPKIKQSLSQTHWQDREDLEQELKLKMIEVIIRYDIESSPGFWDFKKLLEK